MLKENAGKESRDVAFSIGAFESIDRRGTKGIAPSEPSFK